MGGNHKLGCFGFLALCALLVCALYVLIFVFPIVAGVGSWFLMRYVWRSMVNEVPDNGFVRWGLARPPIARKAIAVVMSGVIAFVVALGVGVFASNLRFNSSNTHSNTPVTQPATTGFATTDAATSGQVATGAASVAAATGSKDKAASAADGEGSGKQASNVEKGLAITASTSTR